MNAPDYLAAVTAALEQLQSSPAARHLSSRGYMSWSSVAGRVAELLMQYPDGVTESIMLSRLMFPPQGTSSGIKEIKERQHVYPRAILDFTILSSAAHSNGKALIVLGDADVNLDGASAALRLKHVPDPRFCALIGTDLLRAGRRMRATSCAVGELAPEGGNLHLLPVALAVLLISPSTSADDARLVEQASRAGRVRGAPSLPAGPIALRILRTADVEHHASRRLRRVLLCRSGAVSAAEPEAAHEVECELLLWDEQLPLCNLLPDSAQICVHGAQLLSHGDPALGGAPAQLGYGEGTVCLVVDEKLAEPTDGAAAPAALIGRLLVGPALIDVGASELTVVLRLQPLVVSGGAAACEHATAKVELRTALGPVSSQLDSAVRPRTSRERVVTVWVLHVTPKS